MYATSTYLTLALVAASTATTIYGQQQSAKSQEQAAAYNNRNAQLTARNKELETAEAIKRQRQRDRRERARLRASLVNTGTLTTSGTPLLLMGQAAANQDLAIQDALRASNMEAQGIRSGGTMGLWEASQASSAADLASAGTVLSAAASATDSYPYPRTKKA